MRASIHVSAQPSAPWAQQAVAASTPIPKRVPSRWRETISASAGAELGAEVVVTGDRDVAAERVDEPERAVGGVVLERARVGRVREHPLGEGRGRASQRPAPLLEPAGGEEQALVRRHQRRATTRRTTDSRRPRSGRRGQITNWSAASTSCCVDGPGAPERARRALRRALARRLHDRCGARKLAVERGGRRRDLVSSSPGSSSAPKVPAAQRSSRSFRPRAASSRARTPRYQAPPGSPAGAGDPVGALEHEAVRGRLDRRDRRPRSARRGRCATCRAASARACTGRSARMRRWTTPDRAAAVRHRQLALERRRPRPASASAARRRRASNETSSSWPRGSTRAVAPFVGREPVAARRRRRAPGRAPRARASG